MKILTINSTYKAYSTGKIIRDIETILKPAGYSFIHCYEFGDADAEDNAYRLSGNVEFRICYKVTRLLGLQYGALSFANVRLLNKIRKEKPDIVHIHCPNALSVNLYMLLDYLKKQHIKTIITNHAEFFYTGNCAYAKECSGYLTGCKACEDFKEAGKSVWFNRTGEAWKKMQRAFLDFQHIYMVAVSPWAEARLGQSTICKHLPHCTILNGIDTENIFYPRACSRKDIFRDREGQRILLHVTSRFTDNEEDLKGGHYIIKLAEYCQKQQVDCKFVVVGPCSLEKEYAHLRNLTFLGYLDDQAELAGLYSMADLTVVTSKRETFGMSCAESMCCGTPVVGFMSGGTESIALPRYSEFVEYGNLEKLQTVVLDWITRKESLSFELAMEAAQVYSKKSMAENYRKLYDKMMQNGEIE